MKLVSSFSERLREAMALRDVRAIDISVNTGISKPQISHYLRGHYKPKQEAVMKIARYLRVSEVWLMGYDDCERERYANNDEGIKREIIDLIDNIKDIDKLNNIKKYIEVFC